MSTHPTHPAGPRRPRPLPRSARLGTLATVVVALVAASAAPLAASADDERDVATAAEVVPPAPALTMGDVLEALSDDALVLADGYVRSVDPPMLELPPEDSDPPDEIDPDAPLAIEAAPSASQAFSLHSRPGAEKTILLDFDGHVTEGTAWNDDGSRSTIRSGPYSRERPGEEDATLSDHELAGIVDVWQRVAEDFAPWDVDVTTEDPGVDALSRTTSTDRRYGVRVVVSPDYTWFSTSRYGGIAYLRSFDSYDLPAFVFSSNLANGNPKSVAEAASHEAGHTLGLSHDGHEDGAGTLTSYYGGHGDWAPIMGVGYRRPVTQWSSGEYAGATNTEDDLTLIDRHLTRIPDTSGHVALGSTDSRTRHTLSVGGRTARHRLDVTSGPVTVTVDRWDPLGNLLADLRIRNSSGTIVAAATPTDPTSWHLSATLPSNVPPGAYTVEVRSIGWQTSSTGFSSYASVGDYVLTVDVPVGSGPIGTTTTTTTTTTTVPPSAGTSGPATTTPGGSGGTTTTTTPAVQRPEPVRGDRLTAVSPRRVLDTRSDPSVSRLRAGETVRLPIRGIPSSSSAVVANVAAVKPSSTGYLSVTPCGPDGPGPGTSSLNFVAGRNIGNSIIAPLSTAGELCIRTSATTDVLLDVTGWIGPDGATALGEIAATRVVDSRSGTGIAGRLVPGHRTVVRLGDVVGPDTGAVAINITAVNPSSSGYVTVDDCSDRSSATSSLNFTAGRTRGNNGIFSVGSGGVLCVTGSTATHITLDVTGRFGVGDGLTFVAASPRRVLDTRDTGRLGAGASIGFDVPTAVTSDGLRTQAAAASVTVAATQHVGPGYVTAWDCGPRPGTSALNPVPGVPTANSALVPITAGGRTCLFHATGGHLIVDLNGWWV